MEIPDLILPTDLGASRGVRRRLRQSFPAVRVAHACPEIVGEAANRRFADRLERQRILGEEADGEGGEQYISVPGLVYGIGLEILRVGETLVTADNALAGARRKRRAACDRRDDLKRRLYRRRVDFREETRGLLGRERSRQCLILEGETVRDPRELVRQVRFDLVWAEDPPENLQRSIVGLDMGWAPRTAPLAALAGELDLAIDAVEGERGPVNLALEARTFAIADFDSTYGKGARLLESVLIYLGLPTLAAMVRPHLKVAGRVGRPKMKREVDLYPDLVRRAIASRLLPEDTVAAAEATLAEATPEPEDPSAAGKVVRWPARAIQWWRRRLRAA